jgi:hypothetical protein
MFPYKAIFALVLSLLLAASAATAQEFRTRLSGPNRKVVIEMRDSKVVVEGYDGDEVIIRGQVEPDDEPSFWPRFGSAGAQDNTRLGLAVTTTSHTVRIIKVAGQDGRYTIRVPRQSDVVYQELNTKGEDLLMRNLEGQLEATMINSGATFLGVRGSVVASSSNGNLTVHYVGLGSAPSALTAVSGDVKVTLPAASKASFSLRTTDGEIHTDFPLSTHSNAAHLPPPGGHALSGLANGGGTRLTLQSVSGDVLVRQAR